MQAHRKATVDFLYSWKGAAFLRLIAVCVLLASCARHDSTPATVATVSVQTGTISVAQEALLGGSDGSGGKGVVCRAPDGSVESVELLDLWEERVVRHHEIPPTTKPVGEQVAAAIEALKGAVVRAPGAYYQIVHEGANNGQGPVSDYNSSQLTESVLLFLRGSPTITRLRGQVTLTLTRDSYEPVQPTGNCRVEQLVNFLDSDSKPEVLINQDLLDKMDDTNKAALYAHEAFYAFLRGFGSEAAMGAYREMDSLRVRRAIGYVFSGHAFRSIDELVGKEYVACNGGRAGSSSLFFFRDAKGRARIANTFTFGKPAVGFFPEQATVFTDWNRLLKALKGAPCTRPATRDAQKDSAHPDSEDDGSIYDQYYRNPGVGPVDFQTKTFLKVECNRHRAVFYLLDGSTEFDPELSKGQQPPQKLICSIVKPEK